MTLVPNANDAYLLHEDELALPHLGIDGRVLHVVDEIEVVGIGQIALSDAEGRVGAQVVCLLYVNVWYVCACV